MRRNIMTVLNKTLIIIMALFMAVYVLCPVPIQASSLPAAPQAPFIYADAAVLMESSTGKVIFAKNERKRVYPASMIKILTAIVALEYLSPDELIVTGKEVEAIPADSSKSGHVAGETISVLNLLRGMMMAGNESACVLALAAARRFSGDPNMIYSTAERVFCEMMNAKAVELGAVESNFTNPHGYHNDNMYSTAYDMALLSQAAMKNDIIRQVSAETGFSGNGAGQMANDSMLTRNYNWRSGNELLSGGTHFYQYATGLKTGYHSLAGNCLAASASKDGTELISVLVNDDERWQDAINLFNYGFENYTFHEIYQASSVIGKVPVQKPRLQDESHLGYIITESVEAYLRQDELERLRTEVNFNPELFVTESGEPFFISPIEESQSIGEVIVSIDGNVLYTGGIIAAGAVLERTFSTDVEFFLDKVKSIFFTAQAVPYWIIAGLVLIIVIYIIVRLRRRRSNDFMFSSNRKFFR